MPVQSKHFVAPHFPFPAAPRWASRRSASISPSSCIRTKSTRLRTPSWSFTIPFVVAGAGGYSKLGTLHKINGRPALAPLQLSDTLRPECYDDQYFGFMRLEVTKTQIVGSYFSAPYQEGATPRTRLTDGFTVDLAARTVRQIPLTVLELSCVRAGPGYADGPGRVTKLTRH